MDSLHFCLRWVWTARTMPQSMTAAANSLRNQIRFRLRSRPRMIWNEVQTLMVTRASRHQVIVIAVRLCPRR